jgi:hypothetical protein
MFLDEADIAPGPLAENAGGIFVLTNPAAGLTYTSEYELHFQGNYDYQAHAHVYAGGADPLGSQGYASAVKKSFQLLDAACEAKSSRAFLFMGRIFVGQASACLVLMLRSRKLRQDRLKPVLQLCA